MNRPSQSFNDTQFFDWDSEPALERPSTFFYPDELTPAQQRAHARSAAKRRRGALAMLVTCTAVLCLGLVALVSLAPFVQRIL